jgi:hypothetical protein
MTPGAQLGADWGLTAIFTVGWLLCLKFGVLPGRLWIRRAENPRWFRFLIIALGLVPAFTLVLAVLDTLGLLPTG